ncbi:inositol-1-monophosphatase [gamma proteobacterium HTCC5015]|nr:inositol-1-monophosphatase [gamma proteobacterium HTCC5015]
MGGHFTKPEARIASIGKAPVKNSVKMRIALLHIDAYRDCTKSETEVTMHPLLNIAIRAARQAGNTLTRHADQLDRFNVEEKSRNDFVSDIDRLAEAEIIEIIRKAYPDHAILAEESGEDGSHDMQWIIDPLDGTTNYLHGFPQYAISIAVRLRDRLEIGVVYNPVTEELFTAARGSGAMLNNKRIRVSNRLGLQGALIGTGIPFSPDRDFEAYLNTMKKFMGTTAGIRRPGAAALDLAYVAAGRLDGFWEDHLKPWDIAAGALLIQEAGGLISDFNGQKTHLKSGEVVCGTPKVYNEMLALVKPDSGAE